MKYPEQPLGPDSSAEGGYRPSLANGETSSLTRLVPAAWFGDDPHILFALADDKETVNQSETSLSGRTTPISASDSVAEAHLRTVEVKD